MRYLLKFYFELFIKSGIPFAFFIAIVDFISGRDMYFDRYILLCLGFGVSMSLLMGSIHLYELRNLNIHIVNGDYWKPNQTRDFQSKYSIEEFLERIKPDTFFKTIKQDPKTGEIILKSGASWKSWGEIIRIAINETAEMGYQYKVNSKPKLSWTLTDFGKNLENINRIRQVVS
jgi:hypothetical protein